MKKEVDPDYKKMQIGETVDSAGWQYVEELINDLIKECKDPSNIKSDLKDAEYAREVRAGVMAGEKLTKLLKDIKLKIKRFGSKQNVDYD